MLLACSLAHWPAEVVEAVQAVEAQSVATLAPLRGALGDHRSHCSILLACSGTTTLEGGVDACGFCRSSVEFLQGGSTAWRQAPTRQRNAFPDPCQQQRRSAVARGALTMSPRTEEQLRRRANNERRRYISKRMASLKERYPLIPPEVLERATLRQVSVAVRRIGDGQSALSAFKPGECSSGSISNILPLDSQA